MFNVPLPLLRRGRRRVRSVEKRYAAQVSHPEISGMTIAASLFGQKINNTKQ
jgi:hypothetical protein